MQVLSHCAALKKKSLKNARLSRRDLKTLP